MRKFLSATVLAGALLPATALAQQTPAPPATPTTPNTPVTSTATAVPTQPPATQAPATPAPGPTMVQRFAGSTFSATARANLPTFFPDLQQTQNPTVVGSLNLAPRFTINRYVQLRASITFNYEATNSDTTTTVNEPRFLDPILSVFFRGVPQFAGVSTNPFISLGIPVSPESRANTLILNTTVGVQFFRGFEHVLGGDLAIIARAQYNHPFFQYNTAGIRGAAPPRSCGAGVEVTSCASGQLSGNYNLANSIGWALILVQEWGRFQPGLFFQMTHDWSYAPTSMAMTNTPSPTNYNQSTFFAAWIDVAWNPWLITEVGYQMFRPSIMDADGTIGNPFWSQYRRMDVYAQAIFNLDKLYQAIAGDARGQGGVIRAHNAVRTPFGAF